jgi:predicted RNase H-like nuclease (RuvC/YqgF family)
MTTMIAELYDALLAAGSPEDKARSAAEAMAGYEAYEGRFIRIESDIAELKRDVADLKRDVAEIKRDISGIEGRLSRLKGDALLMKWMLGFVLTFQAALFIKLFLH